MSLPINKEYLEQSFVDYDMYLHNKDTSIHTHGNKDTLDKISESDQGTLLFDGKEFSNGQDGANGKSAYEIAVDNGFNGTESEWLESLKGEPGKNANVNSITPASIGAAATNHKHGDMKSIVFSEFEPITVEDNVIIMVYE